MKNTLLFSIKKRLLTNNSFSPFLMGAFVFLLLFSSCGSNKFQRELGQVAAFAEAVKAGSKPMALSPSMMPAAMDEFYLLAKQEAAKYGVDVKRENDFLATALFPESATANKEVLILYKGSTLDTYEAIKEDKASLIAANKYNKAARLDISRRLGRLLGYQPSYINSLIASNTDFRTLSDFGIQATNVFLYYKDLASATNFYQKTLGLELLGAYENSSIFKVANASMLVLVDEAKGMHSANEDKSVALAFLTRDLPNWYAHLQEQNVEIKYTYKPTEGGPHDGFVAIDPEGYLLEFELFKPHKENEPFATLLAQNEEVNTSIIYNDSPLGFHGNITWLYHKDLVALQNFYEDILGLDLVADQGWTKIYQGSKTGFIGLVDERRGMRDYSDEKAVNMSFVLSDLEGWHKYVQSNNVMPMKEQELTVGPDQKYKAFVAFGPELYFYEFDQFKEHSLNQKIIEFLNK